MQTDFLFADKQTDFQLKEKKHEWKAPLVFQKLGVARGKGVG